MLRFGVSDNGKLDLLPTLNDGNDYNTIEALRSELLAVQGPIDRLRERYVLSPNIPQASLFGPLTLKYDEELSKDPRKINYTVLYARGARFYAARRAAAQQVASGEWPEFDAQEREAIDAICGLHGPLIMASADGRKIVGDAHQYEVPHDVFEEDGRTIEEFGQVIAAATEIVEPATAEAYREITTKIEGDPHPARSNVLGIAATGSALSVIVGGAAWYGAGGTVATFVVPAAAVGVAGLVGGFFWEAIKTMPSFKSATSKVGEGFEKAIDKAEKLADPKERVLLERMADLVERNKSLFARVASLRPEFEWAKRFINKKDAESSNKLTCQIAIVGARGSGKTKIGQELANRLDVPFVQTERNEPATASFFPGEYRSPQDDRAQQIQATKTLVELLGHPPSVIEVETELARLDEAWSLMEEQAVVIFVDTDSDGRQLEAASNNAKDDMSFFKNRAQIAVLPILDVEAFDAVSFIVDRLRRMPGTFEPRLRVGR